MNIVNAIATIIVRLVSLLALSLIAVAMIGAVVYSAQIGVMFALWVILGEVLGLYLLSVINS